MRKKTNVNMLSTKKQDNGNTLKESSLEEFPTQWSFHNLPLSIFLQQIENGTEDKEIYNQFFNVIKDKEARYIQKLIEDINILRTRFNLAQLAVKYFELIGLIEDQEPDKEVMEVLSTYLAVKPGDSLKIILTRSKKLLADIDLKEAELNRISPPNKEGKRADRKYFSHMIKEVQKHLKFTIIKSETSLGEFSEMVIDLRDTIERQQCQTN